jgi:hypothetical protein|tara:strand:- start:365 stop:1141 length:777 start_codon:yes stop_codon:yes gene_type:complete
MKLKKEKQLIKFIYSEEFAGVEPIVPSSKALPEWYRHLPAQLTHNSSLEEIKRGNTIKGCMPVFDAMTQGYTIPLWVDLYVTITYKDSNRDLNPTPIVNFTWPPDNSKPGPNQYVSTHAWHQTAGVPIMEMSLGGSPAFKLQSPWIIETPKNYSTLFVPILNNPPKNISFFSAVVATDNYLDKINFPFVWTGEEEWEGLIPKGTPLIQVIPFKRDDFQHEIIKLNQVDKAKIDNTRQRVQTSFMNAYKQYFRRKVSSI